MSAAGVLIQKKSPLNIFRAPLISGCMLMLLAGCNSPAPPRPTRFSLLPPAETGLAFENTLPEQTPDSMNIIQYLYYYNGGGVAAGDVNNDGLADLYFTSNTGPNRLYLNRGGFKFEDVTEQAGVAGTGSWKTGVTMADVDGDGWLDIYVCQVGKYKRFVGRNQLFVNNRDGTFTERARDFQLDLQAFCTQAAFFDYDRDGDLDCFVACHSVHAPGNYRDTSLTRKYDPLSADRLLRNDSPPQRQAPGPPQPPLQGGGASRLGFPGAPGAKPLPPEGGAGGGQGPGAGGGQGAGRFVDVSRAMGIYGGPAGYGLGLGVGDLNGDGWPDLYVGNDFHENDYLYYNRGGRRFEEAAARSFGHTSNFSMGCDLADYNNDGRTDIVTLDMRPEDEPTYKASQPVDPYDIYRFKHSLGYHWQLPHNCLQLNRGASPPQPPLQGGGAPRLAPRESQAAAALPPEGGAGGGLRAGGGRFSEIAELAGVAATDWSWSALFADLDLDGRKDLYVTNGIVRRPNDLDFLKFISSKEAQQNASDLELIEKMPSGAAANYVFHNRGDLTFADSSAAWGLNTKGIANGAVYVDLDNDGDLDLVTNNLDAPASVYRNNTRGAHFVKLRFEGAGANRFGIGAQVWAESGSKRQYFENFCTRGFQSAVEPVVTIGLGADTLVSLTVIWPDGRSQSLRNVAADTVLTLRQTEASGRWTWPGEPVRRKPAPGWPEPVFFPHAHQENAFVDNTREKLIPWFVSAPGPRLAVGDFDRDSIDDVYVTGRPGTLFFQTRLGGFAAEPLNLDLPPEEETAAAAFDADGDGDLDLWLSYGSYEKNYPADTTLNVLLVNDGTARFSVGGRYPGFGGGPVRAADVDADGDLDLFLAGRAQPGRYGDPGRSALLVNDGRGQFTDRTAELAPDLARAGMVTDAVWIDADLDGRPDLVTAGEWMPVIVWQNTGTDFTRHDVPNSTGLWCSLLPADFDGDGDTDLLAGNLGLNTALRASTAEPLGLWLADFDDNGTPDPILTYYRQGKNYVWADKDLLVSQMPSLRKDFVEYGKFANSVFDDVFPRKKREKARRLQAEQLASCYLENRGNGQWELRPLPNEAQFSPVFAAVATDFNTDGRPDALLGGNFYEVQPAIGRLDAGHGALLHGNGQGGFNSTQPDQTGWWLPGPVRDLAWLRAASGRRILLAGVNGGEILAYRLDR